MLTVRATRVTAGMNTQKNTEGSTVWIPIGSSTGGGAALMAAAEAGEEIGAVVSRGGRPDLAGDALPLVRCLTLLIVGGEDEEVNTPERIGHGKASLQKGTQNHPPRHASV
jgi:putative phosphoribosyl transferase